MVKEGVSKELTDMLGRLHAKYDIVRKWEQEIVNTGLLALDTVTCKGGIPRGLLVDLYGDEGLGKTTMTLTMVAERLRHGERCAYIDVEHRLQKDLLEGIIPDANQRKLLEIFEPKDGDDAFSVVEQILQYPEFRFVTVDSLAALVFPEIKEEDKHTEPIAINARRIGIHTKKIMEMIYANNAIVVFINQMRMAQTGGWTGFAKTATGGKALRFFSSLRINLKAGQLIKSVDQIVGQTVKVVIDKNSFGPPHKETQFILNYFPVGIDRTSDLITCAEELGIVSRSGSWVRFKFKGAKGEEEIQGQGDRGLAEKLAPVWDKALKQVQEALTEKFKKPVSVQDAKAEATKAESK